MLENTQSVEPENQFMHFWKINDAKAQKNGAHRSVYWVKKKKR
jgi:hypothetical protein